MKRMLTLILLTALCQQPGVAEVVVPDWARDSVWYQIYPERFRNGDRSNDLVLFQDC